MIKMKLKIGCIVWYFWNGWC